MKSRHTDPAAMLYAARYQMFLNQYAIKFQYQMTIKIKPSAYENM
jgi:hypothetical protein